MKLEKFTIKNFRGYKDYTSIDFSNLTAFVGKNDVGKSTVLEALDIFFNEKKALTILEKDDINKSNLETDNEIVFSACFSDLPQEIMIDATHSTNLADEYLLNSEGLLEIVKIYKDAGSGKVYIKANHPSNSECSDLLAKKNPELKKIVDNNRIDCNKTINSEMRKAIWDYYKNDLQLIEKEIDVSVKGDTDGIKSIWEKLQNYIPIYSLFQSDRKNTDTDDEVQNPLQTAVKQILSSQNIQEKLKEISDEVLNKLQDVATATLEKLNDINPNLASTLSPRIPSSDALKWNEVFKKVSIASNEDIPINKRGSGVKRLILLSFFQAEADKQKDENNNRGIIYAIEEPETSQHFEHQIILINSLKKLADNTNTQVIITTHSSLIVKNLKKENIRLIKDNNGIKEIHKIEKTHLEPLSLNEVNFHSFEAPSIEYHQELFCHLYEKYCNSITTGSPSIYGFNKWLINEYSVPTTKIWHRNDGRGSPNEPSTLPYYIRNKTDHPDAPNNDPYTVDELTKSIETMEYICETIEGAENQSASNTSIVLTKEK